jgi:predicted extracellular nuclease
MKRHLLIWLGLAAALIVQAALPAVPDLGNARIIVLANNLQNYYIHPNTGRGNYTEEQIAAKTEKIAEAMVTSNADVFAFCEVEAKPDVLEHLAAAMNTKAGQENRYVALNDGIDEDWDDYYNNNIKAGYIYRSDKVQPYSGNYYAKNVTYYKNVLRIQAWEELSSGERFTLSMNHFKAMTDDASKAKRVDNANWLVTALANSRYVKDPDILIMGDLNAQMDESCISIIEDAGFEEQLIRFDEDAYSYIYYGSYELIDHAFANSTMAEQITKAVVWHTNTAQSYSYRYSDHDAVLVGLRLGDEDPIIDGVEQVGTNPQVQKTMRHGQLIIIRGGIEYTITGQRL